MTECGDVAVRGGLVDVFPPNLPEPVRIEFGFEEVESVRTFDPDTQRSTGSLDARPPAADGGHARHREEPRARARGPRRLPDGGRRAAGPARPRRSAEERRARGAPAAPLRRRRSDLDPRPRALVRPRGRRPRGGRARSSPARPIFSASTTRRCGRRGSRSRTRSGSRGTPTGRRSSSASRSRRVRARRPVGRDGPVGAESVLSFEDRLPDVPREIERARRDGLAVVLVGPDEGGARARRADPRRVRDRLRRGRRRRDRAARARAPAASSTAARRRASSSARAASSLLTATDVLGEPRAAAPRRKAASEAFLSDLRDLKPATSSSTATTASASSAASSRSTTAGVAREMVDLRYAGDAKLLVPVERLDLLQKYQSGGDGPAAAARQARRHRVGEAEGVASGRPSRTSPTSS